MLALSSGSASLSSTFIIIMIAAVIVAFFWRTLLKIGIAAMIIGFAFVLVSGLLDILHALRGLIP
jgi:hypothetical protein